jgi:hypothetical protein
MGGITRSRYLPERYHAGPNGAGMKAAMDHGKAPQRRKGQAANGGTDPQIPRGNHDMLKTTGSAFFGKG